MNDSIDRQKAIEIADAIWTVTGDKNVAKVWQQLKDLPSVEPEIIRCKDCKYSDTFPENADNDMPLKCLGIRYGGVFPDWYCEHAERRRMSDLISRQGVFIPDITVEMFRNASLEGVEDLLASGEMEDISLPSAEPKWILCSDRMPPDPAGCFVTAMDEVFTIGFIARWTGEQWCDDAGNPCLCDVIAWMPLPELYEV